MVWENENPDDKNLESMRNQFSLENIMNADVLTEAPSADNLGEGQMRLVYTGGTLYTYTKYDGNLYRQSWSAV